MQSITRLTETKVTAMTGIYTTTLSLKINSDINGVLVSARSQGTVNDDSDDESKEDHVVVPTQQIHQCSEIKHQLWVLHQHGYKKNHGKRIIDDQLPANNNQN